MNSNYLNNSII